MRTWAWLALVCVAVAGAAMEVLQDYQDEDEDTDFTNMWLVEIHGGEDVARRLASSLGYTYVGPADGFEDHYVLQRSDHPEVSKRNSHHLTRSLQDLDEVKWAEQQSILKRTKRGFIPQAKGDQQERQQEEQATQRNQNLYNLLLGLTANSIPSSGSNSPFAGSHHTFLPTGSLSFKPGKIGKPTTYYGTSLGSSDKIQGQGDLSKLGKFSTKPSSAGLSTYKGVTKHVQCLSSKRSAYEKMFNDPLWTKQWYAQDYRTNNMPVMDHNVVPVYKMGITGKSVTVAVVDDGVQHGHPDLEGNFLESLSYDMCNDKPGSTPDETSGKPASHGTKCAGEIAMVANNNKCGVGIAYNAKVAGIKTLGRRTVDYTEARGLIYGLERFDIYSNSWGPPDDGKALQKVGRMTELSIKKGITQGRKGKGAIYIFAGGNGRHEGDNCALDGMINNPYTIPIASVSQKGKTAYYSERCTAIFAGAYSGGNGYDEAVATIDVNGGCTTTFSGTSAAAPIATGIIALALDANPKLTYRDVMHLITMSSEVAPLADNGDIWYKNGKGFWVSNDFGFGLLNAENMVNMAKKWKTVPKKNTCVVSVKLEDPEYLTLGDMAKIQFTTQACQNTKDDAVRYLEQIEVACVVQYPYRGALSITLISPAGTKSKLLEPRPKDSHKIGLDDWTIKTVHNWGENPKGTWEVQVEANPVTGMAAASGYVQEFTFTFHGTAEQPSHYSQLPRKYSGFRLQNGMTSEV